MIHRLHNSKSRLHMIFPSISPLCDCCKSAEGSLTHLFWTCPQLYNSWCEILNWFSGIYGCVFKPDPEIALFGFSSSLQNHSLSLQRTIMYGMIIAKRVILNLWKSDTSPQFKTWLTDLTSVLHIEKIRYGMMGSLDKFSNIWQPFLDYLTQFNRIPGQWAVYTAYLLGKSLLWDILC